MGVRVLIVAAMLLAACGGPAARPTPAPSPLAQAELKYRVMDAGGRIEFCDRDFYPIARDDERDLARARIGEIRGDAATYAAITARVGADELAVYREWKALEALVLTPPSSGSASAPRTWSFAYRAGGATPKQNGTRVEGTVDVFGTVNITKRTDAGPLMCPICLARGTRIATPSGDAAVEDLRVGDVVWTQDARGERVAAPLVAVGSTPVPRTHQVVRITLDDGRSVLVSPGHPTADGRRAGDLVPGDVLDGARVLGTERIAYAGGATYDVLPAGPTGVYWANGIRLGSTLTAP